MNFRYLSKNSIALILILACCKFSSIYAIQTTHNSNWIKNPNKILLNFFLPTKSKIEKINIPIKKLEQRIKRSPTNEAIEPVFITLSKDEKKISQIGAKYAKKDKVNELIKHLRISSMLMNETEKKLKLPLTQKLSSLINLRSLANTYSYKHHKIEIISEDLIENEELFKTALSQIEPFLIDSQKRELITKFYNKENIIVDENFLPPFPEKVIKKYTIFRGPNCFHASLAFHSQQLTRSEFFNVKREEGYHKAMINYDELWRILQTNFYEINPRISALKYGDILVFFDTPQNEPEHVYFRWIKHTATYIFSNYLFSKGSKSANSTYTIQTIDDEWKTWSKRTKNLAIKVFRRGTKNVKKTPPKKLTDWIY